MELSERQKKANRFKERFGVDWPRFFTMVKMLLRNTLNLDFKSDFKRSLIKTILAVLGFAAVTTVSYFFFSLSSRFQIFSILSFVPESVPSLITMTVYFLGYIPALLSLLKLLYWNNDNKIMITFPCNANTVFVARMFVFFVSQFLKTLLIEIPFLFGYMIFSRFPWYYMLWMVVGWFLLVLFEVLFLSILSIPGYFVSHFLKRHNVLSVISASLFFIALVGFVAWIVSLLPNKLDLFSSWGPYFNRIQGALNFYTNKLVFFYDLTLMSMGENTGFGSVYFSGAAWFTLLGTIVAILVVFVLMLIFVNPLYFGLASSSNDFIAKGKAKAYRFPQHSYFTAQVQKEAILFFKNPDIFSGFFGTFVFMPIYITLIGKMFGAMATNVRGDMMVMAIICLLILMISLMSNLTIAGIYSAEGDAFSLSRSYPRSESFMLSSKLFAPAALGLISIIVSIILFSNVRTVEPFVSAFLALGIIGFYLGHLLYAASLDFTSHQDHFADRNFASDSEKRVMIFGVVVSLLAALFYYYFLQDFTGWFGLSRQATATLKFAIMAAIYLILNVVLYVKKIKLIYQQGATL
ncbi:MAG: hypothetical protein BWY98_00544 [Tenericutes bacterium ADurb.BinA155]|jgi:hypothetical protein|nr:MAG: hypothetical protein BWY98_00544 [Tenericutes bacterium ADurb.BinA155]